jgi:hypothetical protein
MRDFSPNASLALMAKGKESVARKEERAVQKAESFIDCRASLLSR